MCYMFDGDRIDVCGERVSIKILSFTTVPKNVVQPIELDAGDQLLLDCSDLINVENQRFQTRRDIICPHNFQC